MNEPMPRHQPRPSLQDALGTLCTEGREAATFLWQVPDDRQVRTQLGGILERVKAECERQGRREMRRIVDELERALQASPSPPQVEILQDGFDRLTQLWQAARSGLL